MTEPVPPCVILNEPQLAENIGAVARVMANFGLSDLRMVRPRDGWPQERAWACASGADWPLDGAKIFTTLEEAVADLRLLYATTARPRELHLPVITPREAAANLHGAAASGQATGLLFGGERAGLETHDTIADTAPPAFGEGEPPADQASMLRLYEHLEGELDEAGFFHPPEKRPSMVKNLRGALTRARFTDQEVRTFRGVITALGRGRGQVLAKLAAGKRQEP